MYTTFSEATYKCGSPGIALFAGSRTFSHFKQFPGYAAFKQDRNRIFNPELDSAEYPASPSWLTEGGERILPPIHNDIFWTKYDCWLAIIAKYQWIHFENSDGIILGERTPNFWRRQLGPLSAL